MSTRAGERAGQSDPPASAPRATRSAVFVGVGILGSRLAGLVRSRAVAHYFGLGDVADAWAAAFRIPNVLQNLFGDQALSASFIPVYAALLARTIGLRAGLGRARA